MWLNVQECKPEPQWNTTSHKTNTKEQSKHQECREIGTLLYCKLECKMMHAAAVGNNIAIFWEDLRIWLPYESAIALLNLNPKELKICVFEERFKDASLFQYFFKIAKRWMPSTSLKIAKSIKIGIYIIEYIICTITQIIYTNIFKIHSIGYYLTLKMMEILILLNNVHGFKSWFTTTKDTNLMILLPWDCWNT